VPLSVSPLPESYKKISSHKYDDTKAWWVYNRVAEECYKKYSIIKKDVLAQAIKNEQESAALINELEHSTLASSAISEQLTANALRIQNEWKNLWHTLIVKYNQGFLNTRVQWAATLGYPEDFLLDKSNGWLKKDPYSYKQ
jgi:dipeptidase